MSLRLACASALLGLILPAAAQAAPQMLGVVASVEPIPMTCDGERCTAELSAFCLQRGRSGPQDGTGYWAVEPDAITLVAYGADGASRTVAASRARLTFESARGYSAVTVSAPAALREALGAARLAVSVAPRLTLAPLPVAGDPQPLTDKEIAETSTALRALASDLFDGSARPEITTARAINRLINALPRSGSSEAIDLSAPDGLWSRVIGAEPGTASSDPGMAQAALAYQSCRRGAHFVQGLTLRRCLEASHDALMSSLNTRYWDIVGAGS